MLNLVALMDVFTILVFFFLVHSSDVVDTAHPDIIELPESLADRKPKETVVVMITKDTILVQGERTASVSSVMRTSGTEIDVLATALRKQLGRKRLTPSATNERQREVTIMGDKSIPFALLKKVMLTCTRAGYQRISLAVLQKPSSTG